MWVFAYGSLMGDGWERPFGVLRRQVASLAGYERSFTKASTVNWGSKTHPAPTLRIVESIGSSCQGVAFELPDSRAAEVFEYLDGREGKNFGRINVSLDLDTGQEVEAITYQYQGEGLINSSDSATLAAMARAATGRDGTGVQYVAQTRKALSEEGLSDKAVDALWAALGEDPGKTILRYENLQLGDIVLTTTSEFMSGAIRKVTKSDISHAMIYVDTASVIDATPDGVHARNTQRILFDAERAVHVLRLREPLPAIDAAAIVEFVRQRVGTRYSKREAARVVLGGGKAWKDRQFCSRLVAQAYASRGYKLVEDPDYCSPDDLQQSPSLIEVRDCLRPATDADIAFAASIDPTQMMRDATQRLLSAARQKDNKIADLNGIYEHLTAHPEDDAHMHAALRSSGYLTVWTHEVQKHPWRYDDDLMSGMPVSDQLRDYCKQTVEAAAEATYHRRLNALSSAQLADTYKLATFEELAELDDLLDRLDSARRTVAAKWLAEHDRDLLPPLVLEPHSPEWFRYFEVVDPPVAAQARFIIAAEGSEQVCSKCGDDPAPAYQLQGEYLPGELVPTLRLCDDCREIRAGMGEIFVPVGS